MAICPEHYKAWKNRGKSDMFVFCFSRLFLVFVSRLSEVSVPPSPSDYRFFCIHARPGLTNEKHCFDNIGRNQVCHQVAMKSSFSWAYVIKCCYYRMLFTKTVHLGIKTSEIGEDFFRIIIASVTYTCSLRFNLH